MSVSNQDVSQLSEDKSVKYQDVSQLSEDRSVIRGHVSQISGQVCQLSEDRSVSYQRTCQCNSSTDPQSAVVLSQVQATTTTAQPIKVPQFVPPPRLTPRPTFQPQVRPCKTRLHTLTPLQISVCGPPEVTRSLSSRGQECTKANTHALLRGTKTLFALCCLYSSFLLSLCFF